MKKLLLGLLLLTVPLISAGTTYGQFKQTRDDSPYAIIMTNMYVIGVIETIYFGDIDSKRDESKRTHCLSDYYDKLHPTESLAVGMVTLEDGALSVLEVGISEQILNNTQITRLIMIGVQKFYTCDVVKIKQFRDGYQSQKNDPHTAEMPPLIIDPHEFNNKPEPKSEFYNPDLPEVNI